MGGDFTSIFSDYNLNAEIDDSFFGGEILFVEKEANLKDSIYWEESRPIPLTENEVKDYVKKDSLQEVWKSKEFLDSIDRMTNKLRIGDIFFGYNYNRTYKKRYKTELAGKKER